jgi:hypothetical protein
MGTSMDSGPCPTCNGIDVDLVQAPDMSGYFYRCNYCRGTFGSSRSQQSNPFPNGFGSGQSGSGFQNSRPTGPNRRAGSIPDSQFATSSGVYGSDPRNADRMILLFAGLFRLIRWILLKTYLFFRNRKSK